MDQVAKMDQEAKMDQVKIEMENEDELNKVAGEVLEPKKKNVLFEQHLMRRKLNLELKKIAGSDGFSIKYSKKGSLKSLNSPKSMKSSKSVGTPKSLNSPKSMNSSKSKKSLHSDNMDASQGGNSISDSNESSLGKQAREFIAHRALKKYSFLLDYTMLRVSSTAKFKMNVHLAFRVGLGVMLAGMAQTRNPDAMDVSNANSVTFDRNIKKWLFLPSYYYLGGLSYAAVALIFSVGKTMGETIQLSWEAFSGISIALLFNVLLFQIVPVTHDNLLEIKLTVTGINYWVGQTDLFMFIPFILAFTFIITMLPLAIGTKKFAVGMNIYFVLTIINPMDPIYANTVKQPDDDFFGVSNIMSNLMLYFLVGVAGSVLALFTMLIPYPMLAITQLREITTELHADVEQLLNIVVDTYCLGKQSAAQTDIIQKKLKRSLKRIRSRLQTAQSLLKFVWWEQLLGFHTISDFHKGVFTQYIRLISSLVDYLRSMKRAMKMEKYEKIHEHSMKHLRHDIYKIQTRASMMLHEISQEIHASSKKLNLQQVEKLRLALETMLSRYQIKQRTLFNTMDSEKIPAKKTLSLNMFLFGLVSFCESLLYFEETFNKKKFSTKHRIRRFVNKSIQEFSNWTYYDKEQALTAAKVTLAIFLGLLPAIFVYRYSATTPSAIAYVMGNRLGGSFSRTSNRVIGVVAGSVIPSIFKFFLCAIDGGFLRNLASNICLFIWVWFSMYVYFHGSATSYAGVVSAFIAAEILLDKCEGISVSGSYGSLVQTSMGMFIFILVELSLRPRSAIILLRDNIQNTLTCLASSFESYYSHHAPEEMGLADVEALKEARYQIQKHIPKLLRDQEALKFEASLEPPLWRPEFSAQKYNKILHGCYCLLNNVNLLEAILQWQQRRNEAKVVGLTFSGHSPDASRERWTYANSSNLEVTIKDSFASLTRLFGRKKLYSKPEDTAVYFKMKQAFEIADVDNNGTIDTLEVLELFQNMLEQDPQFTEKQVDESVEAFTDIVENSGDGGVYTFNEFIEVMEEGLKLDRDLKRLNKAQLSKSLDQFSTETEEGTETIKQAFCRSHDLLIAEATTLDECSAHMLQQYIEWIHHRYDRIEIEDLLVVSCFVSGVRSIAAKLVMLENLTLTE